MIKNYFKLALKVLGRNKFFTGISLFGISFTLLILMLITAMYDSQFGQNPPFTQKDRMVLIDYLKLELMVPDTSYLIDSNLVEGQMTYDSTMTIGETSRSTSTSSVGYYFMDQFMRNIERVETYTFLNEGSSFDVFLNNTKLSVNAIFADAAYWQVFDFPFLEGQAFSTAQVENASYVAVITSMLAKKYFGRESGVLGEEILLGDKTYKVIGVVARSQANHPYVMSDAYIPLSTMEASELDSKEYLGGINGVYLAQTPADKKMIQEELTQRAANSPIVDPDRYNKHSVRPLLFNEYLASQLIDQEHPEKGLFYLRLIFGTLLLFFILLPTLNLINLNVSRIMERSSEIGVRKAFGAHSGTILYQFVFENIILTFIGGAIGLVLALVLIYIINDSQVLPDMTLAFNGRIFGISIFLCLAFGILSGFLPAWRVSRLQIANALKNNIKN